MGKQRTVFLKMRIVVTSTLNNNLFHAKLIPLVRAGMGNQLVVVTDREGPAIEGVTWVWPTGGWRLFGRLGGRLLLLLREIVRGETRIVMAYSLVPHGLFALLLGKLFRKPVFVHFIAGPAELEFAHDRRVTDNRVIARTGNPERWEKMLTVLTKRFDRVFVPGDVTRLSLRAKDIAGDRIVMLHSTVDPERFFPPPDDASRDIDVIVCAQLRDRKRPLLTLDVMAELRRRNPRLRFQWLGDGDMRDEFVAKLMELGLDDVLSWEVTDTVEAYYRRAKIFLLCSVNEGLSLACLEAMACGCVPVVARCGDMQEAVIDGVTGKLLEQGDDQVAFATAAAEILENDETRKRYRDASIAHVTQLHSFPAAQRAWSTLLSSGEF